MHISINMSDPWHICYTLILSKINQRLSYIFIYRLNIEIYLYLFLIIEMFSNYRNIKDPQRYLTQTSYIFLTPMNLRLISSASLCDLLQWERSNEEPSARIWTAQVMIASIPVKGGENQRTGFLLALCCSKFFLGLTLLLRCMTYKMA